MEMKRCGVYQCHTATTYKLLDLSCSNATTSLLEIVFKLESFIIFGRAAKRNLFFNFIYVTLEFSRRTNQEDVNVLIKLLLKSDFFVTL